MTAIELKGNILEIVARFESPKLLQKLYETATELLEKEEDTADWWDDLTPEQQIRLEKSIEESYDKTNWISHEEMKKKHAKWLEK
jgi:hypothetical protein